MSEEKYFADEEIEMMSFTSAKTAPQICSNCKKESNTLSYIQEMSDFKVCRLCIVEALKYIFEQIKESNK